MVDTSLSISVSRLQQQQQYQCKRTQQEYEGVLLDASALQAAYLVAGGIGAPGKEIEEAVHHMTVPPGNGAADAAEDDAVGDELVDLIDVEAVIGCRPQAVEAAGKRIGNRLFFAFIHKSGHSYGDNRNGNACSCHAPVEVDGIGFAVGADEVAERNKSGNYRNCGKEHQGNGHGKGRLVRRVLMAVAFIACRLLPRLRTAPENAVIQSEHIECGHGGNHRHNPTHIPK